ncbi:MAG: hypothetical protein IT169_19360 [Bryobacterales bacterium]|nr:hypothetical protein [Bryobacterales bacterium]
MINAKNQRAVGWIQVEAYNVADLLLKLRLVEQFETLDRVRLRVVALPDSVPHRPGHPQVSGKHPHAPVGAAIAWTRLPCRVENALLQLWRQNGRGALAPANARDSGHFRFGERGAQRQHRGRETFNRPAMFALATP